MNVILDTLWKDTRKFGGSDVDRGRTSEGPSRSKTSSEISELGSALFAKRSLELSRLRRVLEFSRGARVFGAGLTLLRLPPRVGCASLPSKSAESVAPLARLCACGSASGSRLPRRCGCTSESGARLERREPPPS